MSAWGSTQGRKTTPPIPEVDTTTPEMATAADGTYPAGMHSCLLFLYIYYIGLRVIPVQLLYYASGWHLM